MPRAWWDRDDAPSYHNEPTSPAAEHIAPERNIGPFRYTANVSAYGWFSFTADDDEDAADVAEQLLSEGGFRSAGIELEDVEIDNITRDDG